MAAKNNDPGHRETDDLLGSLEKRIAREYKQASEEAEKKLINYLRQFRQDDKRHKKLVHDGKLSESDYNAWRKDKMMGRKRWKQIRDTLVEDYANANRIARKMLGEHLKDVYALNYNYGTYEIEHGARMDTAFTLYDRFTVERLLRDNPKLIPDPDKKAAQAIAEGKLKAWDSKKIESVMLQSILQGESIPNIAKRLSETIGEMDAKAAIRTARTMTTGAECAGRIDSYERAKGMGIGMQQVWLATLDGRTRHEHRLLDGQKREVGQPFEVDGYKLKHPGDPTAPAYLVYNCRCTVIAAVEGTKIAEGIEGLERKSKLGEMSYEEWKREKEKKKQEPEFHVVQGKDISVTWKRRPDQYDFEIEDVIAAQGFDGLPRIVNVDEFDRLVHKANEGNGFIAQRSYSAPSQEILDAYREQLYSGKWYVDCSTGGAQYGQGMYCAADYNGKLSDGIRGEMEHYSELGKSRYDGGGFSYIETITLDPSAKIITYKDLVKQIEVFKAGRKKYWDDKIRDVDEFDFDERDKIGRDRKMEEKKFSKLDDGAFAALWGYDAINAENHGESGSYTVILNRTKVILRRPN